MLKKSMQMICCVAGVMLLTACNIQSEIAKSSQLALYEAVPINQQNMLGTWQLLTIADAHDPSAKKATLMGLNNQPIQLQFDEQSVRLINGCNSISAPYQISQNQIVFGAIRSTRMACSPSDDAIDRLAMQWFERGQIRLDRFVDSISHRMLIQLDGKIYHFVRLENK